MARPAVVSNQRVTGLLFSSTPCQAIFDLGVQMDDLGVQGMLDLGHFAVELAFARQAFAQDRQIIQAKHDVLRRHDDRLTVRRMQDIVGRHHQHACFELGFQRKRNVHGHLVAVEIGIECRAHQRMQLDRLAFDQHRLERLDAQAMQRRARFKSTGCSRITSSRISQTFGTLFFDKLLRLFHRGGQTLGGRAANR